MSEGNRSFESADPEFGWRAQRVAWILTTLFLVASSAGLMGQGPLSYQRLTDARNDGSLEIPAVSHMSSEQNWLIETGRKESAAVPLELTIGFDTLRDFNLLRTTPAPAYSTLTSDGMTMTFTSDASSGTRCVMLVLRPERCGLHHVQLRIGGEAFSARQMVLP